MASSDGPVRPVATSRRRMTVVLVASVIFTVGDGSAQLIMSPHLQTRGLEPATIGTMIAGYSVAALVFRFVTGALYRPRTSRRLIVAGCALTLSALLVTAGATDPRMLRASIAVNGAGFAIVSTGTLAAVMDMRRGTNAGVAMGVFTGTIGAGYAIANFLGGALADALGTATTIRLTALLPIAAAVLLVPALSVLLESEVSEQGTAPSPSRRTTWRPRRPDLRRVLSIGPLVWLAFLAGLHVNLLSGILATFFPLYALSIGLTFTQIGALNGISATISSGVRFAAGALFARVPYRPTMPWMVALGSLGVALFALPRPAFLLLAAAFAAVGTSRGVLRVASAALTMDGAGDEHGARGRATGVYMAGLDLGRILAPIAGGIAVEAIGYRGTFLLSAFLIPAIYTGFALRLRATIG